MHHSRPLLLSVVTVGLLVASSQTAEARRGAGLVLITHGETVKKVCDLPAVVRTAMRGETGEELAVGYKYSQFGVFWMSLWTWGGEYCLFHDNNVYEGTEDQISTLLGSPVVKEGKPWQYRFPPGLLAVGTLVGGLLVVSRFSKDDMAEQSERIAKLFEDPRYQRAIEIIHEEPEASEDGGFSKAVNHLMSQGVPQTEAEQNLAVMLHVLAEHAQSQADAGEPSGDA